MKIIKYQKFIIIIVIILLSGLYYINKNPIITKEVVVNLKWKHQAQFAGMYVAKEEGYYNKAGLKVDLKEFDFNIRNIDALIEGESQFVLMSTEEFLLYVDEGLDIKAVAAFYQTSPYVIVSLVSSDINAPGDFLNKTLGTKGGKIEEEIFYLILLDKYGISKDSVNIKEIGFDKRELDDLLDGDTDTIGLYRTDQLYFFEKENINYNIIYPEQFGININNDILVTTNTLIENEPQLVEDFVKNTIKGWEEAIGNPDKAVNVTMKYITDDNYKDKVYERHILDNSILLVKPSTSQLVGFMDPISMEKLYNTMQDNNFLKNNFVIENFYTNYFIE